MFIASSLAACLLCAACMATAARAQEQQQQQQPEARKTETTQGTPPAPKKANARPTSDAAPRAEPFDGTSVEKMSAQCVAFETEAGAIEVEMFAEAAPESVRGFLNLAATGAFDTTVFSRIVRGFVVQGGNLTTRETLTEALVKRMRRTLPDEPSAVKHVRGVLSMARGDAPNSATTHFFILVSDSPHLDGKFAAFGRVRAGMDVVDALNKAPTEGDKPVTPVRIKRAVVAPCASRPAPPPTAETPTTRPPE